jgi:hypothetical protein
VDAHIQHLIPMIMNGNCSSHAFLEGENAQQVEVRVRLVQAGVV